MGMAAAGGALAGAALSSSGGKGGGEAPPQVDPVALAEAQAKANRVNTFTPFGSITFSGPNRSTANVELSPEQQQLLDFQQQVGLDTSGAASDLAGFLQTDPFQIQGDAPQAMGAEAATDAAFTRGLNLLTPEFDRQESQTLQRLADMGLPMGGEAFNEEMNRVDRSQGQQLENLALSSQLTGRELASAELADALTARQQGINEQITERQQPISEIQALLGQAPINMPQQVNAAPVDIMGPAQMQQNAQMAQFQHGQQQRQSMMQGMYGLGSAAIMASSADFKEDEGPADSILARLNTLPIRAWRYKHAPAGLEGTQVGPYAEDFKEVFGIGDGRSIPMVSAIGLCMAAIQDLSRQVEVLRG